MRRLDDCVFSGEAIGGIELELGLELEWELGVAFGLGAKSKSIWEL